MSNDLNFYINGEWVKSESNELIDVINPATEEVIGQVTAGTKEDIDKAVSAALEAFSTFQQTTKEQRIELLNNIISEYENRYDDFVQIITKEMGAPIWLSEAAQAKTGIKNIHETLDALKDYEFERPEGDYTLIKEPIGVIGMITPWNWPMNQITTKVSAALAAGCTMVLKPSEISPYCAMLLAEVFDRAGVPNGVFNVVNGYGPTVGAALSEHPDVAWRIQCCKWIWSHCWCSAFRTSRCSYDVIYWFNQSWNRCSSSFCSFSKACSPGIRWKIIEYNS